MAPQDVSGHADLLDNGSQVGEGEGDRAETKAQDDAALLVRLRQIITARSIQATC